MLRRTLHRLRRLLFSRKSLVVYLILITLTVLFYTGYRWQGRRAWAAERERLIAAGEPVTLAQLREPLPPEEENFFATPALKELFTTGANAEHMKMWMRLKTATAYTRSGKPYSRNVSFPEMEAPLEEWCRVFRKTGALPAESAAVPAAEALLADHRYDALIEELCAAALRPYARLPLPEDRKNGSENPPLAWDTQNVLWMTLRSLTLHARAQILTGNSSRAAQIGTVLSRIAEGYFREENLLDFLRGSGSLMFRGALLHTGVKDHLWTERDLEMLQKPDLRPLLSLALPGVFQHERIVATEMTLNHESQLYAGAYTDFRSSIARIYLKMIPEGWWMMQSVKASRYMQRLEQACGPLKPGESWTARLQPLSEIQEPFHRDSISFFMRPLANEWNYNRVPAGLVRTLIRFEQQNLALALERHRLREKRYPAGLADLQPVPEGGIPRDFDGRPMRYRTNPEGSAFTVWSVGMNGIDETAAPVKESDDLRFSTE